MFEDLALRLVVECVEGFELADQSSPMFKTRGRPFGSGIKYKIYQKVYLGCREAAQKGRPMTVSKYCRELCRQGGPDFDPAYRGRKPEVLETLYHQAHRQIEDWKRDEAQRIKTANGAPQ